MSQVDSRTYLADGGYIQKGAEVNVYESDLSNEVKDLLPSRWYRDDKVFQLERRAIFSRVNIPWRSQSDEFSNSRYRLVLAYRIVRGTLPEGWRLSDI